MSDTLRAAAQQALDALMNSRPVAFEEDAVKLVRAHQEAITALRAALAAAVAEPDMRHPKIQALIGLNARWEIEMRMIAQLLDEGPDAEMSAMCMEYWNSIHDKLREALMRTAEVAPDEPERRCGGPGCDGNCCRPVAAAVAEPVAYSIGRTLHWHPGRGVNDAQLYAAPPQREPDVWECRVGGLKPLTQRLYEMQPENIQRHYTRICPPQRERWRALVAALLPMAEESLTRPELDPVCLDARGMLAASAPKEQP